MPVHHLVANIEGPLRKRPRYDRPSYGAPMNSVVSGPLMGSEVLIELLTALPEWAARLQAIASKFPEQANALIAPVDPSEVDASPRPPIRKVDRPASIPENSAPKVELGSKKMNAKPGCAKAKFSSITGPDILYDGESQTCFFDCWTSLNSKRGILRKELMGIRRKRVMSAPMSGYGYSDSDEELEAEDSGDKEETEEDRLQQIEEERLAVLEEIKKKEEEKRGKILEAIDGYLEKASKGCENAAFLWLKGQGCTGHIVYITGRIADAVERIKLEMPPPPPPPPPAPTADDDDEGFVDEDLDLELVPEEEELPHKRAGDRHQTFPPSNPPPVEMSG